MKKNLAVLALAALLLMTASAADFDYTYAELARSRAHSDIFFGGYGSGTGYRLDGSFGFAGAQKTLAGLGAHLSVSGQLDYLVHADYGEAATMTPNAPFVSGSSFNDHGHNFGVGLRLRPLPRLELDANVDHDDLGFGAVRGRLGNPYDFVAAQAGNKTVLSGAVRYRVGTLGVGVECRYGDFQGWRDWPFSLRVNF